MLILLLCNFDIIHIIDATYFIAAHSGGAPECACAIKFQCWFVVASYPGHSQFFNVARFSACNIEKWVWPGNEAIHISVSVLFSH